MAHSAFDRIMSEARIRLPGAIDEGMKLELFSVLDEFFRRTMLWQESIPLGVIPERKTYDIDSDEWIATVNELLWVINKDQISVPAAMEQAGVLELYNYPVENQTLTVRVALALADALDEDGFPQIPQWIITKYHEAFKDGLLNHMAMQPSKPYYNKEMALVHGARFRSWMNSTYYDMQSKNVFGGQSWRYPQSFATTRRQ